MLYKVNDHPNLVKDSHSKAILNTDTSAVKRHQERFARVYKDQSRDQEIAQLKTDVSDIKKMLSQLLGALGQKEE